MSKVDAKDGPYAYKGDQWVGYDTKKSAVAKVNHKSILWWNEEEQRNAWIEFMIFLQANYVLSNNLGGAMFWETSTDDFNVRTYISQRLELLNWYTTVFYHCRIVVEEAIILL